MSNAKKRIKPKILIADYSDANRLIRANMLGDEFEIIEAAGGLQAAALLQNRSMELSLVLLDIDAPETNGFEILAMMNENRLIGNVPVIVISSETVPSCIERTYELGVTDYIIRPFNALVVRRRIANTIRLYARQQQLIGLVADQIYEKEKINNLMISILSHIVEFRNVESGSHVIHVQTFTEILLNHLIQITDKYNLSRADITLISNAAALHDIGKICVNDSILNKPGKLTLEEFNIVKTHSAAGASMLDAMYVYRDEPFVKVAYEICRWHHERYDGGGYPDGLKGDEIPISAQAVSLADVYDALISQRVYKKAYSHDEAISMILNGECGAFNPLLLRCLKESEKTIRDELTVPADEDYDEKKLRGIAEDMIRRDELSASKLMLHMMEHERLKNNLYTPVSN
ncbi:MAG: HD-GYP domain-containing protein [Clostridia bacterium]